MKLSIINYVLYSFAAKQSKALCRECPKPFVPMTEVTTMSRDCWEQGAVPPPSHTSPVSECAWREECPTGGIF